MARVLVLAIGLLLAACWRQEAPTSTTANAETAVAAFGTVSPPRLYSVTPSKVWQSTWPVTLTGIGFDASTKVRMLRNGVVFGTGPILSWSPTSITVELQLTGWPNGTWMVQAFTPQLITSNALPITVQSVPLVLTSVSPTRVPRGRFYLTLTGSGLDGRASAQIFRTGDIVKGVTVLSRSPTQLVVESSLTVFVPAWYTIRLYNSNMSQSNEISFYVY